MNGGKEIGQEFASAHAEQKPCRGHEKSVHAGQDAGQDWNGKDNAAKTAENLVRDPARCPGVILLEQFLVGNIAGHAKGYQGIKYGAAYNGKQHQVAGL